MLKISHRHGCIHLEKFSLLALVVTGLLQSQDILVCLNRDCRSGSCHSV